MSKSAKTFTGVFIPAELLKLRSLYLEEKVVVAMMSHEGVCCYNLEPASALIAERIGVSKHYVESIAKSLQERRYVLTQAAKHGEADAFISALSHEFPTPGEKADGAAS